MVDASDERFREQMRVTEETLRELGAEKIPCIHVMNKADKIMDPGELPKIDGNRIYLSAKQGYGIPALLSLIEEKLYAGKPGGRVPHSLQPRRAGQLPERKRVGSYLRISAGGRENCGKLPGEGL